MWRKERAERLAEKTRVEIEAYEAWKARDGNEHDPVEEKRWAYSRTFLSIRYRSHGCRTTCR